MLRRIKYRLLRWLLDDICKRGGVEAWDCKKCTLDYEIDVDGFRGWSCLLNDVFAQARKVWGLEE